MENYRKIIGSLIVFFLSIFITQNVNAFNVTTQVEPTGNSWDFSSSQYEYKADPNVSTWVTPTTGSAGTLRFEKYSGESGYPRVDMYGMRPKTKITVQNGLYYSTQLNINWTYVGGNLAKTKSLLANHFVNDNDFSVVTWDGGTCTEINAEEIADIYVNNIAAYTCWYEIVLQAKHDGEVYFQLGNGTNLLGFGIYPFRSAWKIQPVTELTPTNSTAQAEEKTEEQSEEGQNNADSADSDNEQASQNVISVIGDIIGAFSTPAGDCTLPADLGNLDMGNMNLCTGKPPEIAQIINVVGSIIIVYACYKVARNIFRIFIAITAFAQGNGKGNTD